MRIILVVDVDVEQGAPVPTPQAVESACKLGLVRVQHAGLYRSSDLRQVADLMEAHENAE